MDFDINAYSSDEEQFPRRPKIIRNRPNHFEEWDETDFIARFRLSKRTTENLIEEIEELITHPTERNDCLSAENQVLLTLRFLATGSFLSVAGDFCGVHKSTASRTVKRVTVALANLRHRYIKMPQTYEEILTCRQQFFNIARFPRCIGAIDCSHVKIQSPGGDSAEIFRNRKQFFSLNVQTVSDTNLKILDIVSRWPGSAHDAHIFRNSALCARFEMGQFRDSVLVGDSGYPVKKYLVTPLLNINSNAENLYNESLIRTRNVVERSYGVWKRRFPCLAMGLRLKLDTVQALTVATAILHNVAVNENDILPAVNPEQEAAINIVNNVDEELLATQAVGLNYNLNNQSRLNLINNYFARL
ncbi:hypothetical protein Zmor_028356 [Zophobas morio]|uniref:Putative nuclease HARBI1 n=2 Tax=Zophobas morio TaxID=2755281 RepID=A0AA38M3F3_9CUCU|nr:hypothetical protein Zmor_028356 [Zophobas morio]